MDEEGELSTLIKRTSRSTSDYEMETEEMIKLIHRTRDEQLEAISLAYKELETEFVKRRNVTQSGMTRFMEKELDENNSVKLQSKGTSRGVELEIVPAEDVNISVKGEKTTPTETPQTLNLIQTVELDQNLARTFCQYSGKTYVALGSSVNLVDECYHMHRGLITYPEEEGVSFITVSDNRIYTLVANARTFQVHVHVHDLDGQLVNKWEHKDHEFWNLVVVNNQLVIPGQSSRTLYVYSLTGQLVRQIPCPQIAGAGSVSVCAGTGNDVIVSVYNSSQVIRIDISTGEIKWTLTNIAEPLHVICDGGSYILVLSVVDGVQALDVVDVNTGRVCSQMNLQDVVYCKHMSLCDGILAVLSGSWFSPSITYYQVE